MRGILVTIVDLILFYAATVVSFRFRFGTHWPSTNWVATMKVFPIAAGALIVIVLLFDLHQKSRFRTLSEMITTICFANLILCIVYFALSFGFREFASPRSILVLSCLWNAGFQLALGLTFRMTTRMNPCPRTTLLVAGSTSEAQGLSSQFERHHQGADRILLATPPFTDVETLLTSADSVVVAAGVDKAYRSKLITHALTSGKSLQYVPDGSDLLALSVTEEPIGDILSFTYRPLEIGGLYLALKRILDISLSIGLLAVFSLPMLFIYLLIPALSPGDAIYTQLRVGLNGRTFRMYKFRSMSHNAEDLSGPTLATERDPRVTHLGKFIRSTRLDETPQLINVLKGDMSLIGPRPERPEFVSIFENDVPHYQLRHLVRPGITGLAQVQGGYTTNPEEKLRHDLWYIRHYNLMLDVKIIFRTVIVMLHPNYTKGVTKKQADDISTSTIHM